MRIRGRYHTIYYRILAVAMICYTLLAVSCTNKPTNSSEEKMCGQFINYMESEAKAGRMMGERTFKIKMDSFYSNYHARANNCLIYRYSHTGGFYYTVKIYDSSLIFIDSLLTLLEQNDNSKIYPSEYIDALGRKGDLLYAMNHFIQAYTYFFKAGQIADQQSDSCVRHGINYGLAMISYKQKKYRAATDYFKLSYKYGTYCNNLGRASLQGVLDDIALCYERMGYADSAVIYYDSALSVINKYISNTNPLYSMACAVVYGNKGGVLLSQGKTDSSIALLKKGFAINMQPHFDHPDALLTHIKLAKAYLAKNDLPLVLSTLTDIRKELDTISHPLTAEGDWRQLMYQYYDKLGKPDLAYQYYREYATLRDSIWEDDKTQLQTDVSRELKESEQSYQVGLLRKENQVNNLYLEVTISLSLLALAIMILIYVNYNKSKKNVSELTLLNEKVEEQKKQLEQTTAELRTSNLDKDRILHVVAHDLRNPISIIVMLGNIILEEETNEANKESLAMILQASQNSLELISELLEFSSDSKSGETGKKEIADLNELIRSTSGLLQFKAKDKHQTIDLSLPEEPISVNVNKEKINRVLGNLITNAVKFSPEQSTIHISAIKKNGKALIEVRDSGIGIPGSLLPVIFDTFTTAKRSGTAGEPSFGLGLSICKQIIEAHKGRIWAESKEENGTSFYIELPLA